ncbi:CU044_5270 family protein [Actinomycetes bacterium KLBMP 9797]
MDDLKILRALGGPDPVPDTDREARARTALLTRAQAAPATPVRAGRRTRWGRFGWRIAVPAVAAAVAVGALAVVENAGPVTQEGQVGPVVPGLPAAKPANAAEALGYAAKMAAQQPYTPPRPDQWLYLETRTTSGTGPGGFVESGPYETHTGRVWRSLDGKRVAFEKDGKLVTKPSNVASFGFDYATLVNLPADPDAVLAWVRDQVRGVGGGTRDGEDGIAFGTINAILRDNLLPPAVESALFHALGKLSGVTLVPDAVNLDGRPAIAVARVQDGWLRDEMLLDPETYRLIGERAVAIADHTTQAMDGSSRIKKGTIQRLVVRSAAAIVDRPGETSTPR